MEKLAHGIAVAIGLAIWMLSQNIIIAVIVALVVEGIVVVLLTAAKQANDKTRAQLAAWQAGEGSQPPARKLWWRILILVVIGLPTVYWIAATIFVLIMAMMGRGPEPILAVGIILIAIVLCSITSVVAVNLKKTVKWNKALKQPPKPA
jgi:hypothetical protein